MKKKRIAAIALSMAVAAGLVACGGGQAADGTTAAGTTGNVFSTSVCTWAEAQAYP